jgi:cation diffusion facilitator CzcD-associated flavoprotein CzcO
MEFLGASRLQSYVSELNLDEIPASSAASAGFLQPTGAQYHRYAQMVFDRSGVARCQGRVSGIDRTTDHFVLTVRAGAGVDRLETSCLVVATGTRPRRPPAAWEAAGAHTYDHVYRNVQAGRTEAYQGRAVYVVGSGNSALQTAALMASVAASVTVLANKYLGMYPNETDDRFAWRAASQLTWELVVKSGQDRMACDGMGTCVRLLVYDTLNLVEDRIRVSFRADANQHQMGRHSLPDVHRHIPVRAQAGAWVEERPLDQVVIVWATGCEPVYPPGLISLVPKDESGYLHSGPRGETGIPRLFVTGSCAGRRAVNEMVPAEPVTELLTERAGR